MRSCWVLFNSEGLHELMKVFRRWQMTSGIYPRHGVLAKALSQTCAEGQCRRANLQLWIGGALWGPWLAEHLSELTGSVVTTEIYRMRLASFGQSC